MMRLIIIAGPVASGLTGVAVGYAIDFTAAPILRYLGWARPDSGLPWAYCNLKASEASPSSPTKRGKAPAWEFVKKNAKSLYMQFINLWDLQPVRWARFAVGIYIL